MADRHLDGFYSPERIGSGSHQVKPGLTLFQLTSVVLDANLIGVREIPFVSVAAKAVRRSSSEGMANSSPRTGARSYAASLGRKDA